MPSYLEVEYGKRKGSTFPETLYHFLVYQGIDPDDVVDVGTGTGDFLKPWLGASKGEGLDVQNAMRPELQKYFRSLDLDRPFWDGWYGFHDLVFSKSVIEHRSKTLQFMEQLKCMARKGGWVVVMAPDYETCSLTFWDDATHVTPISAERLVMAAKIVGLEVVRIMTVKQTTGLFRPGLQRSIGRLFAACVSQKMALRLEKWTGWAWFRWAKQDALLLIARRPK